MCTQTSIWRAHAWRKKNIVWCKCMYVFTIMKVKNQHIAEPQHYSRADSFVPSTLASASRHPQLDNIELSSLLVLTDAYLARKARRLLDWYFCGPPTFCGPHTPRGWPRSTVISFLPLVIAAWFWRQATQERRRSDAKCAEVCDNVIVGSWVSAD